MIDVKWFTDCESDTQFKVPDEGDCPSNRCYADCGPGARPPCLKWHRDPVPLTALRAKAHLTQVRTGEYQWQAPGEMQALLALIAQDSKDGLEVGCSAAYRAGRS